ncbi:MAG: hypothetical protein ACTSRA_16950 [Promethearchaeota archaeon]
MTENNQEDGKNLKGKDESMDKVADFEFKSYDKDAKYSIVAFNRWEDIGFQRPLGNFLYGYSLMLFTSALYLIFVSFVYNWLWPYPEINGYNGIAGGVFAIVYQLFDTGTAFGIVRFIAEYRIKNPKRMIEYAQFYIWYQMMTGIVQVLIISIVVLNVTVHTRLAYLAWVFLIICQKQWPGMLGTFKSILDGLQQYNKTQILGFVSGEGFQQATNVIFILIGRYLGSNNPQFGELMGMVFGASVGAYVDDFFSMWLAAHYFNKAMKPFGVSAIDCFRWGFSRDVAKECLWFGFQVSIVPLVNTTTSTIMLFMYLDALPQFSTWTSLVGLARGISGVVDVGSFSLTAAIAESYSNGKKRLAQFYIENTFKWNGFLMCFLTFTLLSVLPMAVNEILHLPGLENYILAAPFIIPTLIHKLFMPYIGIPDTILIGTYHIGFYTFNRLLEEANQVFFVWFFLYGIRLQSVFGFSGIVFILSFEHFFPRIIKMILCWVYIHKMIMRVRINIMQTFVIPIIASLPVIFVGLSFYQYAYKPIQGIFGFLGEYATIAPAIIYVLIGLIVIPLCVFLPLTGLLGGWDDFGLLTFRKAVDLSGPSKPISKLLYAAVEFGVKRSKWHNKFKIEWKDAAKEINELMLLKEQQKAVKYEKPISTTAPWLKKLFKKDQG